MAILVDAVGDVDLTSIVPKTIFSVFVVRGAHIATDSRACAHTFLWLSTLVTLVTLTLSISAACTLYTRSASTRECCSQLVTFVVRRLRTRRRSRLLDRALT